MKRLEGQVLRMLLLKQIGSSVSFRYSHYVREPTLAARLPSWFGFPFAPIVLVVLKELGQQALQHMFWVEKAAVMVPLALQSLLLRDC